MFLTTTRRTLLAGATAAVVAQPARAADPIDAATITPQGGTVTIPRAVASASAVAMGSAAFGMHRIASTRSPTSLVMSATCLPTLPWPSRTANCAISRGCAATARRNSAKHIFRQGVAA